MRLTKFLLLLVILSYFLAASIVFYLLSKKDSTPPQKLVTQNSLGKVISGALTGTTGTYGIAVKNLKTGESYFQNETRVFAAASLYKLWLMAAVVTQIEAKQLDKDEILERDVAYLHNKFAIPAEDVELQSGTVSISVREAVSQMITHTNNYDAYLLADRIGFTKASGPGESGNLPTTTAKDTADFLENLYRGRLADAENTNWMLTILKNQTLNHKIPKYLPKETIVAHKTGELDNFTHDAGIVFTESGDYVIVLLTESDNPYGAEDRIARLSQKVFDYF